MEVLDLTTVNAGLAGFQNGFRAGGFGYIVPGSHGNLVRVPIDNFSTAAVEVMDLTAVNPALCRFSGGFAGVHGFGYLVRRRAQVEPPYA